MPVISNPRPLLIFALALLLSGCSDARRVRPLARAHGEEGAKVAAEADLGTGGEQRRRTREEIREEKATLKVIESLPDDRDLSRAEMARLIEEAEKQIPNDEIDADLKREEEESPAAAAAPESPALSGQALNPSPLPSARPSAKPSLLTETPVPPKTPDAKKIEPVKPIAPIVPKKIEPKKTEAPKPPVKIEPAKPATSVWPKPVKPEPPKVESEEDDGVDAEDKRYANAYSGPKTIVDHPRSAPGFELSEVAAELGAMNPKSKYRALQKSLMSSSLASCNFFFAAALIQARGPTSTGAIATTENYRLWGNTAAALDTKYFIPAGWKRITVEEMKQGFRDGKTFDVAIQRDPPKGKKHGHVAIPVGLNADGKVMVAEASYLTESNRIAVYSDASLSSKFKIFARFPGEIAKN